MMKNYKDFKLTDGNYFSKEAEEIFLGSTSFKSWDMTIGPKKVFSTEIEGGCEARELAVKNGEWFKEEKDCFLLGHYVHSWNEGTLQEFLIQHPEMFKKDGSLYAKFSSGDDMINVLKNSKLAMKVLSGEKEKFFTGEIDGVPFKIKIDVLNILKCCFVDLKTTERINKIYWKDGQKVTFFDNYDYGVQVAIYAEILRQNYQEIYEEIKGKYSKKELELFVKYIEANEFFDPYIVAVDKQKYPDHLVLYCGKSWIPEQLEIIKSKLPRMVAVRSGEVEPIGCGRCSYCISKKELIRPISIAEYAEQIGI